MVIVYVIVFQIGLISLPRSKFMVLLSSLMCSASLNFLLCQSCSLARISASSHWMVWHVVLAWTAMPCSGHHIWLPSCVLSVWFQGSCPFRPHKSCHTRIVPYISHVWFFLGVFSYLLSLIDCVVSYWSWTLAWCWYCHTLSLGSHWNPWHTVCKRFLASSLLSHQLVMVWVSVPFLGNFWLINVGNHGLKGFLKVIKFFQNLCTFADIFGTVS